MKFPDFQVTAIYDHPVTEQWLQRTSFVDVCHACWYVRKGLATLSEDGRTRRIKPGHWIWTDPFRRRSQKFTRGTHLISIRFKQVSGYPGDLTSVPFQVLKGQRQPELLTSALALHTSFQHRDATAQAQCTFLSRFYDWLALWHSLRPRQASPSQQVTEGRIVQALEVLQEHKGLGPVPYARIQEATGISRPHIDRLFKRHLKTTPRKWVEQHCLLQAEEWLRENTYSIKEVAYLLGFTDSSHFAKWFRRLTSRSPTEFQRQLWA